MDEYIDLLKKQIEVNPDKSSILELLKETFGEDTNIENLNNKTKLLKKKIEAEVEVLKVEKSDCHNMVHMITTRYMLSLPFWDDSMFYLKNWDGKPSVYIYPIYCFLLGLKKRIDDVNIPILTVNKITELEQVNLANERTLYVAIDIDLPTDYILNNINKMLSEVKKKKKKSGYWDGLASALEKQGLDSMANKLREIGNPQQEWIQYLGPYDLRKRGITYSKVADKIYPQDGKPEAIDRIRKQVKTVEKLMEAWFGNLFFNSYYAKHLRVYRICKKNNTVKDKLITSIVDGLEQIIEGGKFDKNLVAKEVAKHFSL